MIFVRLVDRHGDHYISTHGEHMHDLAPIGEGRTVGAALNSAAEWLACWCGDGFPFRDQWRKRSRRYFRPKTEAQRRRLRELKRRFRSRQGMNTMAAIAAVMVEEERTDTWLPTKR